MSSRKRRVSSTGQSAAKKPLTTPPQIYATRRFSKRPLIAIALFIAACGIIFWQIRAASIRNHLANGRAYARQGKIDKAELEFHAAIDLDSKNATPWEELGEVDLANNRWKEAREAFAQVQRLQPSTPKINLNLANCAASLDDTDAAVTYARAELKRNPDDIDALNIVIKQEFSKNKPDEALEEMRHLAKLQPDDLAELLRLARTLYIKHLNAEAIPIMDHMIALNPNDGRVYFLRGTALLDGSPTPADLAKAESDFKHFQATHPNSYLPHEYLGTTYEKMGKWNQAITEFEATVRNRPELMNVYFDLQTAYRHIKQPGKAAAARAHFMALRRDADRAYHLEKVCAVDQNNFDAFMELGGLLYKAGNYRRSGSAFYHASKIHPADPRPQAELSKVETAIKTSDQDARYWTQPNGSQ